MNLVKKDVQDTAPLEKTEDGAVLSARSSDPADPLRRDDRGRWWFWNEIWADLLGPYDSEAAAVQAAQDYAKSL